MHKKLFLVSFIMLGLTSCTGKSQLSGGSIINVIRSTYTSLHFSYIVDSSANSTSNLSWLPPTENTDNSTLTDIKEFKIYYGPTPDLLVYSVTVEDPNLTNYTIENLYYNTVYFFAITAINNQGIESDRSNIISKHVSFGF